MFQSSKVSLIVVAIVAASVGVFAARTLLAPPAAVTLQSGTALNPPKPIPAFALTDHNDAAFGNDQLRGRWSLLFFGFANCGDICPTTLALMASVKKSLGDLPSEQQPRLIFVSVDPGRDTPDRLKAYVANFHADFVAITGAQANVDAFTKSLGVPSAIRALPDGGYAVDHYAGLLATDPNGDLHALFGAPHTLAALAADVRTLIGARH
jgi:protein SCO1/2